jgi:hypothetical protein
MTPLEVKTCVESDFDIFEAKNLFPDSEKVCVLKRKVEKCDFATFRLNTQAFSESGKCFFGSKMSIPHMFLPLEGSFPENFFAYPYFYEGTRWS